MRRDHQQLDILFINGFAIRIISLRLSSFVTLRPEIVAFTPIDLRPRTTNNNTAKPIMTPAVVAYINT
ncbi:MAG TPA: hypothetical protein VL854_08245 [Nitrososphaeraceae archaeon]|nr:hypothetical protein [Nitrososphaeraceae archaeon]